MSDCIFCHERPEKTRGVCQRCYHYMKREIALGFTTDADMVRAGNILPALTREAVEKQKAGRRAAMAMRKSAIAAKTAEMAARRATV